MSSDCSCSKSERKATSKNISLEKVKWGTTVSYSGQLLKSLKTSSQSTCQFYLANPTSRMPTNVSYNVPNISEIDRECTLKYCLENEKTFYIHCPLSVNFGKEDNMAAVNVVQRQIKNIRGLPGACVLHVGKGNSLEAIADNLSHLKISSNDYLRSSLLLEVGSGQGTEMGTSWKEIRKLWETFDNSKDLGFCLDTQHAFASGLSTFKDHESVVRLFDRAQSKVGKIDLIHLNDSKKPKRSRVDRHEILGQGYIWKKKNESLISLLSYAKEQGIDLISETPDASSDLTYLKTINPDLEF